MDDNDINTLYGVIKSNWEKYLKKEAKRKRRELELRRKEILKLEKMKKRQEQKCLQGQRRQEVQGRRYKALRKECRI